ncbi:hypothetical protein MUB24_14470 [Lederbergia sp. NSJ-179]|uniref:dienelactone hydrolase family protein n=1 Tax=Lederbergia sp. NSJ-179 TaxID=2931402 RepID=UPI001FD1BF82|nr:alpha/beta hydrolase family protein [Lederbergia sp. NSJ-179]MCJ7842086.1 hypothetical protein [Lederbergia sp. NSJ-179]
MWSADVYLDQLYKESVGDPPNLYDDQWKKKLKEKFKTALGDFTYQSVDQEPTLLEKQDMGKYIRYRIEWTTIPPLKMPIYLLIPKNHSLPLPTVLAIHGHGYGHKELVGLNPNGSPRSKSTYHEDFAVDLVQKGFAVVVPELIGFGDRKLQEDQGRGKPTDNSCYRLASQLLLYGKTLAGLRVYECIRVIDYLETQKEYDLSKLGCMGISGGGLVTAFTSILDERIKATVISGYTNTFKGSIIDRRHCLDNYIPNILQIAEMPELIGLIAPRALFIEAGKEDHLFPLEHVQIALTKLQEIYLAFDAETSLDAHIFDGGHEICGEQSYDWLVRQLLQ